MGNQRYVWLLYIHSLAKYQRTDHLLDHMSLYGYAVEELALYLRGVPSLAGKVEVKPVRLPSLSDFDRLRLAAQMERAPPLILGLSCYDWNLELSLEWLKDFRVLWPDVPVVIGGASASNPAEVRAMTQERIDYVVPGEGELVLGRIVEHVLAGGKAEDLDAELPVSVPNRPEPGPRCNRRAFLPDLDSIPSIYQTPFVRELAPAAVLETSRGCNHACLYCAFNKRPLAFHSVERLRDDVRALVAARNVRYLIFSGAALNEAPDRGTGLFRMLDAEIPEYMRLFFFLNYELFDDEQAELLLRLADRTDVLQVALESSSPEALRIAGRWSARDGIRAFLERCPSRLLPKVVVSMIYGLPGDSLDGFLDTMSWLHEYPIRNVDLNHLMVLHGTRMRGRAAALGVVHQATWPYRVYRSAGWTVQDIFLASLFDHWYNVFQGDPTYRPVRDLLAELKIPFPKVIASILRKLLDKGLSPDGAPFTNDFCHELCVYLMYLSRSLQKHTGASDTSVRFAQVVAALRQARS